MDRIRPSPYRCRMTKIAIADGGIRAVEQLRQVMGQLRVADVTSQVSLSVFTDFVDFTEPKPQPSHVDALHAMLSEVVSWAGALKAVRSR